MSNVVEGNFRSLSAELRGGPRPPDNGDMEQRLTRLESLAEKADARLQTVDKSLIHIAARLDSHEKLFASKEELARVEGSLKSAISEAKSSIILWVVSAFFLAQLLPILLKKLGV